MKRFANAKFGVSDAERMCSVDANRFDTLAVTRSLTHARSRHGMLSGLMLGTIGLLGWSDAQDVTAKDRNTIQDTKRLNRCRKKLNQCRRTRKPITLPPGPANPCAEKNWCVNRTQTCGPAGGFGKCLVQASGGNICGEILFQAATCADCEPANCTNCQCVLAAGGGDRCNNGPSGADFVCVRPV